MGARDIFVPSPIPNSNFFLEQKWFLNVVSSFTNRSRVHKNIQNYEQTQSLDLWRHSLPYIVIFFTISIIWKLLCCVNLSWSKKWRHKHGIIGLTNKSGLNKIFEILYPSSTKRLLPLFIRGKLGTSKIDCGVKI